MTAGLGVGLATLSVRPSDAGRKTSSSAPAPTHGTWIDLQSDTTADQTLALQRHIDELSAHGVPVLLPPGRFNIRNLKLRPRTKLIGVPGLTHLIYAGGHAFVTADNATGIHISGLVLDGQNLALDAHASRALAAFSNCDDLLIDQCTVRASLLDGLALTQCSGGIANCTIEDVRRTGLFSLDANGLDITDNTVRRCSDNGIQIWRTEPGRDDSRIAGNRIENISAKSGGSGQYGNGVNIFRAGQVSVTGNHVKSCAYSAVRGNAASNLQITANACSDIGEVALYAEFAFEGAIIANNMVAGAASGISVTNFDHGGRLATVTGNIIRDLERREFEPVDKRGIGISVEADSVVANNVIENAPTAGLVLGWGTYRRDLVAAQNIIRNAAIGILVSDAEHAGKVLLSANLISNSANGAIRLGQHHNAVGKDLYDHPGLRPDIVRLQNVATG